METLKRDFYFDMFIGILFVRFLRLSFDFNLWGEDDNETSVIFEEPII